MHIILLRDKIIYLHIFQTYAHRVIYLSQNEIKWITSFRLNFMVKRHFKPPFQVERMVEFKIQSGIQAFIWIQIEKKKRFTNGYWSLLNKRYVGYWCRQDFLLNIENFQFRKKQEISRLAFFVDWVGGMPLPCLAWFLRLIIHQYISIMACESQSRIGCLYE